MASKRKCRACGKRLTLDYRNKARQEFCGDSRCQRQRRSENQRRRRNREKHDSAVTRGLKPSEAACLLRNPLIVGLISMLIGSSRPGDIESYCSALVERGTRIFRGELLDTHHKAAKKKALRG
jgi:hypothetical protein